jgi:outer membrane receptor protein involved in Fe transport
MDVTNGQMKTARFGDVLNNRAHELGFFMDYRFTDGTYWTLNAKYMNAPRANYVDFGGSTIREVTAADGSTQKFYGFNELSPEYTKGYENKLALYLSDDWRVNDRLDIYLGGRLEYYRMSADQLPYERYAGFHIGGDIQPQKVVKDKLNYAATARVNYALTNCFSLTADATVATRYPRISEYAGTGPPRSSTIE